MWAAKTAQLNSIDILPLFQKESKEKIFELAIILKKEADNKEIWDTNIEKINTDIDISEKDKKEFEKTKEYMQPTINRNRLLSKKSYVSKK